VAVVKFNESWLDGSSSVCGAEVRGLFKCSNVDAIWAAAAAAAADLASPLPNPQTGSHPTESRLQPYGHQSAFWKVTTRRDILFGN